jgi:hypothetical protein
MTLVIALVEPDSPEPCRLPTSPASQQQNKKGQQQQQQLHNCSNYSQGYTATISRRYVDTHKFCVQLYMDQQPHLTAPHMKHRGMCRACRAKKGVEMINVAIGTPWLVSMTA